MSLLKALGKTPTGARLQRILRSPNYRDGSFQSLVPTEVLLKSTSMWTMLSEYRHKPANTIPPKPIPSVRTDLHTLPDKQATIVWFGHSSYLLQLGTTRILVDPVFSGNASPFTFYAKAFPGADVYKPADMPATLEAILLTHDHYDHLDYKTILQLNPRTNHFYTSLGVGSHLEYWGIPAEKITELDWWESVDTPLFTLTATPARHFSGRSLQRGKTFWSSFVLNTPDPTAAPSGNPNTPAPVTPGNRLNLYLGGDSGYETHFKTIGEKYGPFDLALLECGQYGIHWPYIHLFPEQTVQAALDLKAKALFPVHWGKFSLSLHPWNEPIRRLKAAVDANPEAANLPITTPRIGEPVIINHSYPIDPWYEIL